MKYLYLAKRRGCRVVVVNPYLEPGLEKYWVPSNLESALFGTKMCDLHVPVRPGGDVAFANAALKRLIERGAVDDAFIADHTTGWDELVASLAAQSIDDLLVAAGLSDDQLEAFVDLYAGAASAVLVWSMGITQHRDAVDGVRAIVNLGLARGNVGRDGAGLMPIRGHSGVQGGAEMGAYATAFPGGVPVDAEHADALAAAVGLPGARRAGPHRAGDGRRPRRRAARRALDLGRQLPRGPARSSGGGGRARPRAAARPPGRRGHLADARRRRRRAPAPRGHALRAGGRWHLDHDGATDHLQPRDPAPGRRSAQRVAALRRRGVTRAARARRRVPVDHEPGAAGGDRAGGARLRRASRRWRPPATRCSGAAGTCAPDGQFPLPDGRGGSPPSSRPSTTCPTASFTVATRRGKQFNSMVHAAVDPLTGAGRDAVYIDEADARALGATTARPCGSAARPAPSTAGSRWCGCRPVAAGALARGQRAHLRRRCPPRAALEGARLQRGRHRRGAAARAPR